MRYILITGANSYIGVSFENYLRQWPNQYKVDTIDMIDGTWQKKSFAKYETVYHVAGIAHSDMDGGSEKNRDYYYQINRDLAIRTASKAKQDGVKQFIFMSSIIVYGDSAPIGEYKMITKETIPRPTNFYGDSKLQAEKGLLLLSDDNFKVVILRPPMIYGNACRGNYPILAKLAIRVLIFPDVDNQRSMLYIGNLIEFVRLMIENEEEGIFWPQNSEYTKTSNVVKEIAEAHGEKVHLVRGFSLVLRYLSYVTKKINKVFGNLSYDMAMSEYKVNYRKYSLKESIKLSENKSA